MKIYCFSGLGADHRAFQFLNLPGFELIHVKWISHRERESLTSYAHRISEIIDDTEPFIMLGLSFGGMLVQEIQLIKPAEHIVLLSTIQSESEKPIRMRYFGKLGWYKLIPNRYLVRPSGMADRLFGAHTDREKQLLAEILKDSDPVYLKWAMGAISHWKPTKLITGYRIHGTADNLFPHKNLKCDCLIQGGGHLMVVSHADEVSVKICESLSRFSI